MWCEPADNGGVPTRPLTLEFETGATEVTAYFTEAMPEDVTKDGCRWFLANLRANIRRGDILNKISELSGLMRFKFQMVSNDDYEKVDLARANTQAAVDNGAENVEWIDELKVLMWKSGFVSVKGAGYAKSGGGGAKFGQNAKASTILKGDPGDRATRPVYGYKSASQVVQLFVRMMTTSSEALPEDMHVEMHTGQAVPTMHHDTLIDIWEAKKDMGVLEIDNPKPKRPKLGAFDHNMTVVQVNTELLVELMSLADISKLAKQPKDTGCPVGFNVGIERVKRVECVELVERVDYGVSDVVLAKRICEDSLKKAMDEDDEERMHMLHYRNLEIHNFDEGGVNCEAFALQVTVKQHDGKDDEYGQRIETKKVVTSARLREYTVEFNQLIKVTVTNWGRESMYFVPVYLSTTQDEFYEERQILAPGGEYEMPHPLQKDSGEADDGWMLQNDKGKTILSLIFKLGSKSLRM